MNRRAIALVLGCLLPGALPAQDPAPANAGAPPATADPAVRAQPVVRGVLFYSPGCPHCREVMTETLPPVLARYGTQLQIAAVNTATPGGQVLYRATIEHHQLPRSRIGVPTLLVGSRTLVGALEIPELLPGIVDRALEADGIDWPDVPLIQQALAVQGPSDAPADPAEAPDEEAGPRSRVAATPDPERSEAEAGAEPSEPEPIAAQGRTVGTPDTEEALPAGAEEGAVVAAESVSDGSASGERVPTEVAAEGVGGAAEGVGAAAPGEAAAGSGAPPPAPTGDDLVVAFDGEVAHTLSMTDRFLLDPTGNAMSVVVLILMLAALGLVGADVAGRIRIPRWPGWTVPVLAFVGVGVAAYLTYIEVTGMEAVCGPVGDCNTVQQSPYATLFGAIPVGGLGLVGYVVLLAAWALVRGGSAAMRGAARMPLWILALGAVLFSVYLTFLEPFVIGATCAWCLTSAVITTLILLAATPERRAGRATAAVSHSIP